MRTKEIVEKNGGDIGILQNTLTEYLAKEILPEAVDTLLEGGVSVTMGIPQHLLVEKTSDYLKYYMTKDRYLILSLSIRGEQEA